MVEVRGGAEPTITSLYGEARELLAQGLQQSVGLARAGTRDIWAELAQCSFRAGPTACEIPVGWD